MSLQCIAVMRLMYRACSRAATSMRANLTAQRDPHHVVVRGERVSLCNAGKTSETIFADPQHYAGEVVTNFNQFGRIMSLNQADIDRDQKADPAVGTRLEDGNVSWPASPNHRASARLSLTSGAP